MAERLHLRECLSMPQSMYQEVKLEDASQTVRESFRAIPQRLTESASNDALIKKAMKLRESATDKELFDKVIAKLREAGAGNERKLWKFPVSRFGNKNGNGRIYPRKLWENVIENQRDVWQGGCGLADHPVEDDDPGEFKTSAIVWLDMMIDDANKLIWAIGTFVGEYGRLAQEIIEAGGRVGFSSSGFGELDPFDKTTINADTYQIERVADIVTNPSQSVFGDIGNAHENTNIEYSKQSIVESQSPKSKILKENTNMAAVNAVENKDKLQESTQVPAAKSEMSKMEKAIILKYVENLTSEAEKIKNPAERLKETNKILEMVEESGDEELKEKVTESLIEARNDLTKMIESAVAVQSELGDLSTLAENVKDVTKQGVLLNEQVKDYESLCHALEEKTQALFNENKALKAKLELKESAIKSKSLKNNVSIIKAYEKNDKMVEALTRVESAFNKLQENNRKLSVTNTRLEAENGKLTTALRESEAKLKDKLRLNESKKINDMEITINLLKEQVGRLQLKNKALNASLKAKEKEFREFKEDQKMENHIEPKFESYVTDQLNFRENRGIEVEKYWNDLCNQYGEAKMKPFEKSIRGAKTYREAFNNFIKNLSKIEESAAEYEKARISESIGNLKARKEYLEEAGMETKFDKGLSVDEINNREYEEMKKKGFI